MKDENQNIALLSYKISFCLLNQLKNNSKVRKNNAFHVSKLMTPAHIGEKRESYGNASSKTCTSTTIFKFSLLTQGVGKND